MIFHKFNIIVTNVSPIIDMNPTGSTSSRLTVRDCLKSENEIKSSVTIYDRKKNSQRRKNHNTYRKSKL